jgi:hypothetical protein
LYPRTTPLGAILTFGVMTGALVSHLTRLGIVVKDDGGLLFALAVVCFIGSVGILLIRREQIPLVGRRRFANASEAIG